MRTHTRRESAAASTEARVGETLKALREQYGMSLRTLATRAGFSASFLSQLENGQVSPSLGSLERIANALGATLADLFESARAPGPMVVRAGERPGFTSTWSRARVESLVAPGEKRTIEAIAVTLAPRGVSGKHAAPHRTDQFAYVLVGTVTLVLGEETFTVKAGDSVFIPRRVPHRWENAAARAAQVLLVSTRLTH